MVDKEPKENSCLFKTISSLGSGKNRTSILIIYQCVFMRTKVFVKMTFVSVNKNTCTIHHLLRDPVKEGKTFCQHDICQRDIYQHQ